MKHIRILFALFLLTFSALVFTLFYYEWKIRKNEQIIKELSDENSILKVERIIYNQGDKTNYEL